MTDRCAPPDGSPSGEYWVEFENRTKIVLRWRHDLAAWWFMGAWRTPDEIHFTAVRYLRPCRPDDAEARERLEDENKRLREALDIAREGLLIVSGQSKCIDNLLSHEAVALEALRLIEEPGNAR